MKNTTSIKFRIDKDNEMEVSVSYDTKEPENYEVTSAYHNGRDVTDFYRLCETQSEAIFYPQVVEGIAAEICGKRIEKRQDMPVASWNGASHISPRGFPEHIGTL